MATADEDAYIKTLYMYDKFSDYDFSNDPVFKQGWDKVKEAHLKDIGLHSENTEEFLKSKLFYFSRLCGSKLTIEGYQDWQKVKQLKNIKTQGAEDVSIRGGDVESESHKMEKLTLIDRFPISSVIAYLDTSLDKSQKPTGSANHPTSRDKNIDELHNKNFLGSWALNETTGCTSTDAANEGCCGDKSEALKKHSDDLNVNASNKSDSLSFEQVVQLIQKGEVIPGLEEINILPTNNAPTESALSRVKKPWEM